MEIFKAQAYLYDGEKIEPKEDWVIRERIMNLHVDGEELNEKISCLDENLEEMIMGRFFDYNIIDITMDSENIRVQLGEKRPEAKIKKNTKLNSSYLMNAMSKLVKVSEKFQKTGAVHCAGLCKEEEFIYICEDISRRCAIEKVLGFLKKEAVDVEDCFMAITCRVSEDICETIGGAGVGTIVSKAAVTDRAIAMAKKKGINLIGFARDGKMNIYTGENNIWIK